MGEQHARTSRWFLDASERNSVDGYLQETQARALEALLRCQAHQSITGSLAEIGVYLGKTLIGMARAARPGEHVLGVDPLVIGKRDLAPGLIQNLKRHLSSEEIRRLSIRRSLSTVLSDADWKESVKFPARFVHLDGHHARETILHDLQLASSFLHERAVVVIDDFLNELHPDLTSGIFEGLEATPA